jgi:hypothetical protein
MTPKDDAEVGRLPQRPERLALVHVDGQVSNWFARDQTREDIRQVLSERGLVLWDDGTVVRST